MSKLYLVTGGAGFIGSHIVDALAGRGDRVRVLDDFSTGRRENLAAQPGIEVVEGDLRDAAVVRRALAGVEGVFHQAALRSVPRSVDDPLSSNQVNVTGTLVLLLACRDAGPGIAADVLPHLFEPFHPGRGPERGTGFGLYIVRSFAEALGGRVAARSRLDEGTAVTVELPLVAPARHAPSGAPPARRLSE